MSKTQIYESNSSSKNKEDLEDLEPVQFPPEVFARIAPDLFLQRHLAKGIRPFSLRQLNKFRSVEVGKNTFSRYNSHDITQRINDMDIEDNDNDIQQTIIRNANSNVLGSSIIKSGSTTLLCAITGGILPIDDKSNGEEFMESSAMIYPIVDVSRGKSGMPSDEEMILAQKLFETFYYSKILKNKDLKVNLGQKILNDDNGNIEIIYPNYDNDETAESDEFLSIINNNKKYIYVLYAHLNVFSRSGPLFDLAWGALLSALESTKLPYMYIDDTEPKDLNLKIGVGNRNVRAIKDELDPICDDKNFKQLHLNKSNVGWSSTFGIITLERSALGIFDDNNEDISMDIDDEIPTNLLIADLEGEAEESTISTRLTIIPGQDGVLKSISLQCLGTEITKDDIRESINLARLRSDEMVQQVFK